VEHFLTTVCHKTCSGNDSDILSNISPGQNLSQAEGVTNNDFEIANGGTK